MLTATAASRKESGGGVGEKLQTLRRAQGLSLGGLALRAGINKSTLSRWEAGSQSPRITELEAVLDALRATPSQRLDALTCLQTPRALQRMRRGNGFATDDVFPCGSPPVGGDLLRAMRRRRGWTQERLATHLGEQQWRIARWERSEEWPASANLHTLCHALKAHTAEVAALTRGRFALAGPASATPSAESIQQELMLLTHGSHGAEGEPLKDLRFLALEAQAWHSAACAPSTTFLLAHTQTRRAEFLLDRERFVEATEALAKAVQVAKSLPACLCVFPMQRLWDGSPETLIYILQARLTVAAVSSSISGSRETAAVHAARRRAIAILRESLAAPPNRELGASLLSRAATLYAQMGASTEAYRLVEQALAVAERSGDESTWRFRLRDAASVYLSTGNPEQAVRTLARLPSMAQDKAPAILQDRLLATEAHLALKDRAGATWLMGRAERVSEEAGGVYYQRWMQTLRAQL